VSVPVLTSSPPNKGVPGLAKHRSRQFRQTQGRAAQGIPSEAFLDELPILGDPNFEASQPAHQSGNHLGLYL